jgi:hypothetical protein
METAGNTVSETVPSYASAAAKAGAPAKVVSERLGHATAAFPSRSTATSSPAWTRRPPAPSPT